MTSRGNKAQADALRAAVGAAVKRPGNNGDVEMASVPRPAVSFDVHQQDLESMIIPSFGRPHQLFARGLTQQWPKQRAEDMNKAIPKPTVSRMGEDLVLMPCVTAMVPSVLDGSLAKTGQTKRSQSQSIETRHR